MKGNPRRSQNWQPVLQRMIEELGAGEPRAKVYWAQQLAFGPLFFYAVLVAVRDGALPAGALEILRQVVPSALALLGALPEGSGGDPAALLILARRQAQALALGRRQLLVRLASRLGLEGARPLFEPVPAQLQRPYELLGWYPP